MDVQAVQLVGVEEEGVEVGGWCWMKVIGCA